MSKTIWICSRRKISNSIEQKILEICKKISPDNIVPVKPKIYSSEKVAFGVMNPKNSLLYSGNSLLIGVIVDNIDKWNLPLEEYPDGSYAIFRDNEKYCEIVSDSCASRTIWYYKNDEIFIASTSQVALISFIGNFELDKRVIPWMLSTGSLGPELSWDKRIKRVPADSSVILNKKDWSLKTKTNKIEFKECKRPNKHHEDILKKALKSSIESMKLNYSEWVLPISGGYDSRGILCFLKHKKNLKTVTWGLKSSLEDSKNDAFIAKKITEKLNIPNKYFHTDLSEEPIEKIIDRFLTNGEGRIDHISGYLDGFKIWEIFHNENIQGIIRGDEGFGWANINSPLSTRLSVGLGLCSDYANLKNFKQNELIEQNIPENLEKKSNESLEEWRDRLYHEFRLPTILAALSDLKLSYIEQVNPLLFKKILNAVREQPDELRTEKSLFRKIVTSISPKVPLATRGSNAKTNDIFKQKQFVDLIKQEITQNLDSELLPKSFLINVLESIKISDRSLGKANTFSFGYTLKSIKSIIKSTIPSNFKKLLKNSVSNEINYNQLAFRVYIILRMNNKLTTTTAAS